MKKVISVLLCLTMLAVAVCIPAAATDYAAVVSVSKDIVARPGQEITVPVNVSLTDIGALKF